MDGVLPLGALYLAPEFCATAPLSIFAALSKRVAEEKIFHTHPSLSVAAKLAGRTTDTNRVALRVLDHLLAETKTRDGNAGPDYSNADFETITLGWTFSSSALPH